MFKKCIISLVVLVLFVPFLMAEKPEEPVATFSIAAYDPATGEVGVAVASRFFGVGAVVPWAKAGVGAIATQAYANTSFGWKGLDLLEMGLSADEVLDVLLRTDEQSERRQVGIVAVDGSSMSYTGDGCSDWAGGLFGENYAIQGNILAGEEVVTAMEAAFLSTKGTLSEKMYQALLAGEAQGGDSRGKQSAAIYIAKENAGYGGFTDQAIDIRVDDHAEPFVELGRLLKIAQMNYAWNIAWTLFTEGEYDEALPHMERTARLAPDYPEVQYDLAVLRGAAGDPAGALKALKKAVELNPKLKIQAGGDDDFGELKNNPKFKEIIK